MDLFEHELETLVLGLQSQLVSLTARVAALEAAPPPPAPPPPEETESVLITREVAS
jgi:hypothetical protein